MLSSKTKKNKHLLNGLIPVAVVAAVTSLEQAGFEAYLVGGCIRDILMGTAPKDWDVCTSATPEQIQQVFPESFYENNFGTVGVKTELGVIEVTPYRVEGSYSDGRRPDSVKFSLNIQDDLSRRDFTINAIAYSPEKDIFIDPFDGTKDIKNQIIRAVGVAEDRFNEDGLRIMRMLRFVAQLQFGIDPETLAAAVKTRNMLAKISKERIRDEFTKLVLSDNPAGAFVYAEKTDILEYITPYLKDAVHVEQNGCHAYDVFEHLVRSLQCAADKKYSLDLRLAALFHDIGKPPTRLWSKENKDYTFYGHEVVGAKLTKKILNDLKFSHETVEKVTKLVRWHMFFSDTDQITHSAVRRMIANVGKENIWDLINLRICDRVGTGRPKEDPYRLRKYMSMIEEVLADPTDVSMLKINGNDLINSLEIAPGPIIGKILHILLDICLETPALNTKETLLDKTRELLTLPANELKELYIKALHTKQEENESKINQIKRTYKVS
ncbi:MAG: hypothetical protein RJB39_276 [Candidatus Parcubacteria bacterium]